MVQIELDRPRTLKFNLAAIYELEAAMGGMPLADIISQFTRVGMTAISVGLYVGLKHEDRTLNLQLTRKILQKYIDDGHELRLIARALNDAIEESGLFGREDAVTEGNATAAAS